MPKKIKAKKNYLIPIILFFLFLIICLLIFVFIKKNKDKSITNISPTITLSPIIEITWDQTINLLQECQIVSVYQKNNLKITLTDKNNITYQSTEPKKGDIVYQTNHLRSDCNDIINVITE